MTEQDLRYEIIRAAGHGNGQLEIGYDYLQHIEFFKTTEDVASMESLLLTVSGHSPLKKRYYDFKEVEKWCQKMNFKCKQTEGRNVIISTRV